ncbi:MAG: hypothetical protein KJO26_12635 [Deltaproteobacteria bacterium]|nr:hypothetical protein [Deltaproteobacteria bacterium]
MKTTVIQVLFICMIILNLSGMTLAKDRKIGNVTVPLSDDTKIIAPAKNVPKEISAFSGMWEGKWTDYGTQTALIVEQINSKQAVVTYCLGKSSELYSVPSSCERYKAIVTLKNRQVEFTIGETQVFTYRMGKNLNQIKATKQSPLDKIEIIMTRIK